MTLFIILLLTEVLTLTALSQILQKRSREVFTVTIVIHAILSLWVWMIFLEVTTYKGLYDMPEHVWMIMSMKGIICNVIVPRIILTLFHFTGRAINFKKGGYIKGLTNTGLTISTVFFLIIAFGTFYGRFNFKTENVTIKIRGLKKDLDGLKIVQLSDLHLAGFYHHKKLLQEVIARVNSYHPDLVLNTGDFVSVGWREFDNSDTILSKTISRYGNYAVMGNHDFGTYHPFFTAADREDNVLIMNHLIKSSGYILLNDESRTVKIGNAKIGLIGVITLGRHPDIIHGDLDKAMAGLDSVDLKILLSHDPNHWALKVAGKTDINITLSGHTHGMQMGIYTKRFKWSPARYFYPHWSGLYSRGDQFQYVNRGLGVLAVPFRLWMPPEITVITLKQE